MKVGMFCRLFVTAILLLLSIPSQAQQSRQVLRNHVRPAVSSGRAALVGPLPPEQRLYISIVLPLHNQSGLTSLLSRLYNPSSPDYRHFLSVDQFTEQFAPTVKDYQTVVAFAKANGLTVTSKPANRMIVPISGSAAQIEKAFHLSMNVYRHPTEDRTFYSPDREPSLDLGVPVAHIAGLNNFSIPRPLVMKPSVGRAVTGLAVGSGPGGSYLASDMRAAYYGGTTLTGIGQAVGLVEFDGYNISDVTSTFGGTATSSANGSNYLLAYTPTVGGETYNIPVNNVLLDGTTGAPITGADAEEALDIVQAIGMAPGLSQVRVYIGNSDVDILNAMASENIAKQLSISWGWSPDDPSTDDFIFQEFAAQGQSVFAASGDYGAYDPFVPYYFPAEDVWLTAVGGTDLSTIGAGGSWSSETAWQQSGGGGSPDGIPIPSWQAGVADVSNGGSTTLRNVPDVAAEADFDNYDCNMSVCQGDWGGTSFAAPRWAGFMALVNQQAVAAGNPTVGFINPAIYAVSEGSSYSSDFHDIISGNNNWTGQETFYAVPGYDLVTGWGSPTGQNLVDALAPPASVGFQLSASPSSLTIDPGVSAATTITVLDVGGFTGNVNLAVSGLPSGVTASFGVNPVTENTVLTLTVSSTALRGSYLLTVSGTSGTLTATATFALAVNAPGFSISPSSSSMWVNRGASASTTIEVTDYAGFTGSVNLAVTSVLPKGMTAYWTGNPTTGSSVLTLTASDSTIPWDSAMVMVTGSSGSLSETTSIALEPLAPLFYLITSPIPWTLAQGGSATAVVTAVPVGDFSTGSIALTAPTLPPGVTATFNPNPTTTGSSVVTMTVSSTASVGSSYVYLCGTAAANAGIAYNGFLQTITATPTPTFTVGVSPPSLTLTQGSSGMSTVTVTELNGFTGGVTLSAAQLPNGVTASFGTNPTTGTSVLTLTASSSTAAGAYAMSIFGDSASRTQSAAASFVLTINPAPGFTLGTSSAALTLASGGSITDTITVNPQAGFSGSVDLAVTSTLPSGVTASFATNPTAGAGVLTLNASSSVIPGNYVVIIAGTSSGRTVTTTLPLIVGFTTTTLSINPGGSTLTTGASYTLTARVSSAGGSTTPTGNVIFNIGSATQTVALNSNGIATYTGTAPTAVGTLSLSAAYQGTTGFLPSTSKSLNEAVVTPPSVSLSTTSIVFSSETVDIESAYQPVTLTNTGGSPLFINSIALTGANPAQFLVSGNACPASLAAGANCIIHLRLYPQIAGPASAALTITDNASDSPQSITLTGTGLTPAAVSLSTTSIAFGTQTVGIESAYQPVTLTNTGGSPLIINSITLTGANPAQFLSLNNCPTSLAAGASCAIHPRFYPQVAGPASAALTITDNAVGSTQSVTLLGTGTNAAVSLSTTSIAFGNVTVNTESTYQPVTLTNTGGSPLIINSIALTGTNPAQFLSLNNCPTSLAAGASCAIHPRFYPQVAGPASAALTITDDATSSPQSVSLTGTGTIPVVSLSVASLAFGNVAVKTESLYQPVTLTNTGGSPLTISSIALTGINETQFLISSNYCPASLAAGANCIIHLHFYPQVTGAAVAALTITDNATGSPQSVTLTGMGK